MLDEWRFDTRAVHAGRDAGPIQDSAEPRPEGQGTPVAPGIQPSSSYYFRSARDLDRAFDNPDEGYVYARFGGPTTGAFAQAVAVLEGADGAVAFSSGMAAIHAALLAAGVGPGDTIVAGRDLYGATQTLLTGVFGGQGARVHLADATELGGFVEAIVSMRPRVVFVETVSNPLLRVPDIGAIAGAARRVDARFIVDNTFASPYLCRPVEWGADVIVHSATKYLGGHGDLTAGVVATRGDLLDQVQVVSRLVGGTLGAFDAWLALRGVRTLVLRVERQCANALAVAGYLARHPRVSAVYYPGLRQHPQHQLAGRLFGGRGYGGVLSFELKDADVARVAHFMDALRLILPAPTMGDVYSLCLHPARASHRGLTPEQRAALGIGDGLVRLSLGIEDVHDLIADLDQALAASA